MAERRMFAKSIVDSDNFLDMPSSSQNLYFHLGLRADDDGFINSPNKIIKITGANKNDLDLLFAKSFIIPFFSGICVITHWHVHNKIRKDRYNQTIFIEEKKLLKLDEQGIYTLEKPTDNQLTTNWQPIGNQTAAQVRLVKSSLVKFSLVKSSLKNPKKENQDFEKSFEDLKKIQNQKNFKPNKKNKESEILKIIDELNCSEKLQSTYLDFFYHRKEIKKPITILGFKKIIQQLENWDYDEQQIINCINTSIANGWQGIFELKQQKNNGNNYVNQPKKDVLQELYFEHLEKEQNSSNIILDMEEI